MVPAPSTCPLSPGTCVGLQAWVGSDKECEELCQENKECATYSLVEDQQDGGVIVPDNNKTTAVEGNDIVT